MEEQTLKEQLDKVIEKLEEKEEKKFKLPFGIRIQKGKTRKDSVVVCFIRTNGSVVFKMVKIEDDTIRIGENFYDASSGNILRYKKYPLLIVCEWNMKPVSPGEKLKPALFSAKKNFKEAEKNGTLTAAEKLILTKMKLDAVKPKSAIGGKTILIIIAVIVVGYFAADYFKLF